MTPGAKERWRQAQEILDVLFDSDPATWPQQLDALCGEDAELRSEVEEYLDADAHGDSVRGGVLDTSAAGHAPELVPGGEPETSAVDDPSQPDPLLGTRLGPYRLDQRLGAGGMGVVYLGLDTRLRRRVAVKVLPRELAEGSGEASSSGDARVDRFLREAQLASALDHPNLCTIHDIGKGPQGQPYIVMAYYDGETLEQRLRRGPLPPAQARRVALAVARGLRRAHEAGIVHRDVKPANVMLTTPETGSSSETDMDADVKVLDFGIARMASGLHGGTQLPQATLTQTGMRIGTPAYMSPEQVLGETVDARSDVWALGVLLFQMLSGRRPFEIDHTGGVLRAIVQQETPRLPVQCALFQPIVDRALTKDPAQRHADMGELIAELEAVETTAVEKADKGHAATTLPSIRFEASPLAAILTLVFLATAVTLGTLWLRMPSETSVETPSAAPGSVGTPASHHRLLVLHFRNLRDDPDLDWLRQGLTEMVVTELRQSPDLDVLSTNQLYATLAEVGVLDAPRLTPAQVRQVATRHGKEVVLRGSFLRQGRQCRITYDIERRDGADSRTLAAGQVIEPEGDECFLHLADQLAVEVARRLGAQRLATASGGGAVSAYGPSLLAWRRYSEGLTLANQGRDREAIEHLAEALEIDPDFALALRAKATLHGNLGQNVQRAELMQRAFDLADRLPPRERISVRAGHLSYSWSTLPESNEVYEKGLELYPSRTPWRENLGLNYATQGRYEAALAQYQRALDDGSTWTGARTNTALFYLVLGREREAVELLEAYAAERPELWKVQHVLGVVQALTADDVVSRNTALATLQRARELRGEDDVRILDSLWELHTLAGDLPEAQRVTARMLALDDPGDRIEGMLRQALDEELAGRPQAALAMLEATVSLGEETSVGKLALLHNRHARLLLAVDDPAAAVLAARRAQEASPGDWPEVHGLFLQALAHLDLTQPQAEDAARHLDTARTIWTELQRRVVHRGPDVPPVEQRQMLHLEGRLALARGDLETAQQLLSEAALLLPPRGMEFAEVLPDHVFIWDALVRVAEARGDRAAASAWRRRIAEAGPERLETPGLWLAARGASGDSR